MLVLSRKIGEEIVMPSCQLSVKVLDVGAKSVRLGIAAPAQVPVHRREIWERINNECDPVSKEDSMPIRVLLVDPNEFLLTQYEEYLTKHGYEVLTSSDALDCLEKLRKYSPDLMVLEPILPWGGGDGVLAIINEESDVPKIPVLILTYGTDPSVLFNISSYDISDFQKKPISVKSLAERISRILHHCRRSRLVNVGSTRA
jgi:carbon storage regulator CsrA